MLMLTMMIMKNVYMQNKRKLKIKKFIQQDINRKETEQKSIFSFRFQVVLNPLSMENNR